MKYASKGWKVFPLHTIIDKQCSCNNPDCTSQGKHPRNLHGVLEATNDLNIIKSWWHEFPDSNIGIATGVESGLIVLDVDGKQGEELLKDNKTEPTPIVRTGKGHHFYYSNAGKSVRNFVKKLPDIDLRADGGYVVAPPSKHVSGKIYEWQASPDTLLAQPSQWLLDLIETPKSRMPTDNENQIILEGERNNVLTSYAGVMQRRGFPKEAILTALKIINENQCQPPLPQQEFERIVESVSNYKPEDPIIAKGISLEINNELNLDKVKDVLKKWLCFEKSDGIIDTEIIDIVFTFACDRKIKGDPIWLFLVARSGGAKTELIRSLSDLNIYTLDTLTPRTLISGKINPDTNKSIKGILEKIDGKVLCIKDFTVVLQKRREDRNEIFSQLRAIYDGYFEGAFGTLEEPIRIKSKIGCIFAVTPIIDKYTSLQSLLGERFLKARLELDSEKVTRRALENQGHEDEMRAEIEAISKQYFSSLRFDTEPSVIPETQELILKLSLFVAKMRTIVHAEWIDSNEKIVIDEPETEYGTRLAKQFQKFIKLLAIVRGRTEVRQEDVRTLIRLAEDTCPPQRMNVLKALGQNEGKLPLAEIQKKVGFGSHQAATRHLSDLIALKLIQINMEGNYELETKTKEMFKIIYPEYKLLEPFAYT